LAEQGGEIFHQDRDRPRRYDARPPQRRGPSPRPPACQQGCCAWSAVVRRPRRGAWRLPQVLPPAR
jgi:hypothetical protein